MGYIIIQLEKLLFLQLSMKKNLVAICFIGPFKILCLLILIEPLKYKVSTFIFYMRKGFEREVIAFKDTDKIKAF